MSYEKGPLGFSEERVANGQSSNTLSWKVEEYCCPFGKSPFKMIWYVPT